MSVICPTVTAKTTDDYKEQLDTITSFSKRIHIDLGDGIFTTKLVEVSDIWWPEDVAADIHLMYDVTLEALHALTTLNPHMVIVHAESKDPLEAIEYLRQQSIQVGVSLLQGTSVEETHHLIKLCDHTLVFSGALGSFGGQVDYSLLSKVKQIRDINPDIEIGWDGGINTTNVKSLVDGGIDVLNVGGAIQRANHPENAYRDLVRQLFS